MMQHIAPKRQDVAALPISIEKGPASTEQKATFEDALQHAQPAAGKQVEPSARKELSDNKAPLGEKEPSANKEPSAGKELSAGKEPSADKDSGQTDHTAPSHSDQVSQKNSTTKPDKSGTQDEAALAGALPESEQIAIALPATNPGSTDEATDWLAFVDSIRALEAKAQAAGEGGQGTASASMTLPASATNQAAGQVANELITDALTLAGDAGHQPTPGLPEPTLGQALAALMQTEGSHLPADGTSMPADIQALAEQMISAQINSAGAEAAGAGKSQINSNGEAALASGPQLSAAAEQLLSAIAGLTSGQDAGAASLSDKPAGVAEQLAAMTPQAQQKVIESFTRQLLEQLPASATAGADSQSSSEQISQHLLSGIKEMQAQLEQGHTPGLSIKALVTEAMQQADISLNAGLEQHIDQQVSQLSSILSAARQSASAAVQAMQASHMVSTEAVMVENTQLRSESAPASRQAEGLDSPVNILQPDGQKQLGEKIRWLVNSRNMMAEIRLDPPEMGSMQVRVNVQGDAAAVTFIVQSAQAKEALAQAEPRLREMLAEQGIELGGSSVEQHSGGQASEQDSSRGNSGGHNHGDEADPNERVVEQRLTRQAQGGIDDYA